MLFHMKSFAFVNPPGPIYVHIFLYNPLAKGIYLESISGNYFLLVSPIEVGHMSIFHSCQILVGRIVSY